MKKIEKKVSQVLPTRKAPVEKISPQVVYSVGENEAVVDAIYHHEAKNPELVLYQRPVREAWSDVTAAEFADEVRSVALGLIAQGVRPGDRVAIMSVTRYEWILFAYAVWTAGAVVVPIYPTSSSGQINRILSDSGASFALFENQEMVNVFRGKPTPESLQDYAVIDDAAEDKLIASGLTVKNRDKVLAKRRASVKIDDPLTIVYTSGTTGHPKGVEISQRAMLHEIRALATSETGLKPIAPGKRVLGFLPLAHIFAMAIAILCTERGATQAFWSDVRTISEQFQRFKPNLFVAVPRVYEKIVESMRRKAKLGGPLGNAVFSAAYKTAIRYSQALDKRWMTVSLKFWHRVFDVIVYKSIREGLGGEVDWVIAGGGALDPQLTHFLRGAGVWVLEGYGLTETTAAITVNNPSQWRVGSIGRPLANCSVKCAPDGELLFKGPMIFRRYWNNKEASKEAFTKDGWFRTGDLGVVDRQGYVYITGRKKEILVTAGGKNVSPTPLEQDIVRCPLISHAVVIGDRRKFISCLITLDEESTRDWLQEKGYDATIPADKLRRDPHVREEVQRVIDHANDMVSRAESIKKFRILKRDFTEEDGELTATMKLRRQNINLHFQDEIEKIYRDNRRKAD